VKRLVLLLFAGGVALAAACSSGKAKPHRLAADDAGAAPPKQSAGATSNEPAPKPGMAWIPAGSFRAGTPPDVIPRLPDEELPGTPVQMNGFYIDLLPYPNEPNAIPTTNITRDEAEALCVQKGKRLCTELEWERACKGPESSIYGYGDTYRAEACGTGVPVEQSARRPTGEHAQCKNAFGVSEMHGNVWEWTASSWGRGSPNATHGVLRGGNSVVGELVGRCANGIARNPSKKSPTMGLRCCAGPKNEVEVKLETKGAPGIGPAMALADTYAGEVVGAILTHGPVWSDKPGIEKASKRAWKWTPVANEELAVVMGCADTPPHVCGLIVGRTVEGKTTSLLKMIVGRELPELARLGDARHLRIRALDNLGVFSREITYAYGRVTLGEPTRP
jgi:formylglycine-generating enzyme